MGCVSSQPDMAFDSGISKDVLQHLYLTPFGYHLTPEEIKQLCVDGKIVQCEKGEVLFDRTTAYQQGDNSAVVCMYYFGILCYGLAEVQTFDQYFNKTSLTVSSGTILLGEHLFEVGKRHSLNRGYNILAKTQCTLFLVNLKTFERWSRNLNQQRIEWWNTFSNIETSGAHMLASVFPTLSPQLTREISTFINWRVLDAGQALTPNPLFNPHTISTTLPKSHHAAASRNGGNMQRRPNENNNNNNNNNTPLQYQKVQYDNLGPRSLFIVVKGKLAKYPTALPHDLSVLNHRNNINAATKKNGGGYQNEISLSGGDGGDLSHNNAHASRESGHHSSQHQQPQHPQVTSNGFLHATEFDPAQYSVESKFEPLSYTPGSRPDEQQQFHNLVKNRLELYARNDPVSSLLCTGMLFPNDLVFETTFFEQSQFLLQPLVIAAEKTLVIEIPYHVYRHLSTIQFFQPFIQFIKYRIYNVLATSLAYCNVDFFKLASHDTTYFSLMSAIMAKVNQESQPANSIRHNIQSNGGQSNFQTLVNGGDYATKYGTNAHGGGGGAGAQGGGGQNVAQFLDLGQHVTGDMIYSQVLTNNHRFTQQDYTPAGHASNSNNANPANAQQQAFAALQKQYRELSTTVIFPDIPALNNVSNYAAQSAQDYVTQQHFIVPNTQQLFLNLTNNTLITNYYRNKEQTTNTTPSSQGGGSPSGTPQDNNNNNNNNNNTAAATSSSTTSTTNSNAVVVKPMYTIPGNDYGDALNNNEVQQFFAQMRNFGAAGSTIRGQNMLRIQTLFYQAQYGYLLTLLECSEIHLVKPGDVIQEANRTVIDKCTVILYGSALVSDVSQGQHDDVKEQEKGRLDIDKTYKCNAVLQAGDYFNEMGLVTSFSKPHLIRALTPCIFIQIPRVHFEKTLFSRDVSLFCIKLGRQQAPLEAILSYNITFDAFYQLALSEHSTENLDFYRRILEFRLKMDGVTRNDVKVIRDMSGKKTVAAYTYADLYTELLDVYNHFIRPDHSISQVNLPHHVVDSVKDSLFNDDVHGVGPDGLIEGLTNKVLDGALAEVILLMRRDILSRFLVHPSYAQILANVKQYVCHWKDDKPNNVNGTIVPNPYNNVVVEVDQKNKQQQKTAQDREKDKDKDFGNQSLWAQRFRRLRYPDALHPGFPGVLRDPADLQQLQRFEKFLTELGMGVGNAQNLPIHIIDQ